MTAHLSELISSSQSKAPLKSGQVLGNGFSWMLTEADGGMPDSLAGQVSDHISTDERPLFARRLGLTGSLRYQHIFELDESAKGCVIDLYCIKRQSRLDAIDWISVLPIDANGKVPAPLRKVRKVSLSSDDRASTTRIEQSYFVDNFLRMAIVVQMKNKKGEVSVLSLSLSVREPHPGSDRTLMQEMPGTGRLPEAVNRLFAAAKSAHSEAYVKRLFRANGPGLAQITFAEMMRRDDLPAPFRAQVISSYSDILSS